MYFVEYKKLPFFGNFYHFLVNFYHFLVSIKLICELKYVILLHRSYGK